MAIKIVYRLVDSNLGVEILKKEGLPEKEGGVLETFLPGRWENDLLWGRKGLPGTKVRGKLYRLTIK